MEERIHAFAFFQKNSNTLQSGNSIRGKPAHWYFWPDRNTGRVGEGHLQAAGLIYS